MITEARDRAARAIAAVAADAIVAASPGLVAFLTGHVMPPYLAFPSADVRARRPLVALVTADHVMTGSGDGALQAARELGLTAGRIAVETTHVPADVVAALEALGRAEVLPLGDALWRARAEKDEAEQRLIAGACALARIGHDALAAAVVPGVTDSELAERVTLAIGRAAKGRALVGCELQTGPRTGSSLAAPLPVGAPLAEGDLVLCDLFPRHPSGIWADTCSTLACGAASVEQRRGWDRVLAAMEAGSRLLRPGVPSHEVHDAVAGIVGDSGGHVGHGIGWDHFEEPVIAAGGDKPLPAGAIVVLEPGVVGDGWGMRLEWAFRVTPSGGEPIVPLEALLEARPPVEA